MEKTNIIDLIRDKVVDFINNNKEKVGISVSPFCKDLKDALKYLGFKDWDDFIKQLKTHDDVLIWTMTELMNWGMGDKDYTKELFIYKETDDQVIYHIYDSDPLNPKTRYFIMNNINDEITEVERKKKIIEVEEFEPILNKSCPFCKNRTPLILGEYCLSFFDEYPVSKGHTLVIPKRHVNKMDELTSDEIKDMYVILQQTKYLLQERYNPDGFNIGINEGEAAGQTVPHLHIHIIPRYNGDVDEPRGGIRGVIPNKQKY